MPQLSYEAAPQPIHGPQPGQGGRVFGRKHVKGSKFSGQISIFFLHIKYEENRVKRVFNIHPQVNEKLFIMGKLDTVSMSLKQSVKIPASYVYSPPTEILSSTNMLTDCTKKITWIPIQAGLQLQSALRNQTQHLQCLIWSSTFSYVQLTCISTSIRTLPTLSRDELHQSSCLVGTS